MEGGIWNMRARARVAGHRESESVSSPPRSRCFGPKCAGCGNGIVPQDYVRKAREKVYHLRCFTCSVCAKQLSTGEVLYLQPGEDNTLLCKDDYLKNNGGTATGESRVPIYKSVWRTTFAPPSHRVFNPDSGTRLCQALGSTRLVKPVSCLNGETLGPATTQRAHLEPRNVPLLRAGVPHISLSSQIALRSISPLLSLFLFSPSDEKIPSSWSFLYSPGALP